MPVGILHSHFIRQAQFKELMNRIQNMCTPVAQTAHTEIIPATPLTQMIVLVIFMIRSYSQPRIPFHILRQLLPCRKLIDVCIPLVPTTGVIHMCRYSRYIFDDTSIHPCFKLEVVSLRVTLITHLGNQIRPFQCSLHQQLTFIESTCKRLLYVYMFT